MASAFSEEVDLKIAMQLPAFWDRDPDIVMEDINRLIIGEPISHRPEDVKQRGTEGTLGDGARDNSVQKDGTDYQPAAPVQVSFNRNAKRLEHVASVPDPAIVSREVAGTQRETVRRLAAELADDMPGNVDPRLGEQLRRYAREVESESFNAILADSYLKAIRWFRTNAEIDEIPTFLSGSFEVLFDAHEAFTAGYPDVARHRRLAAASAAPTKDLDPRAIPDLTEKLRGVPEAVDPTIPDKLDQQNALPEPDDAARGEKRVGILASLENLHRVARAAEGIINIASRIATWVAKAISTLISGS